MPYWFQSFDIYICSTWLDQKGVHLTVSSLLVGLIYLLQFGFPFLSLAFIKYDVACLKQSPFTSIISSKHRWKPVSLRGLVPTSFSTEQVCLCLRKSDSLLDHRQWDWDFITGIYMQKYGNWGSAETDHVRDCRWGGSVEYIQGRQ